MSAPSSALPEVLTPAAAPAGIASAADGREPQPRRAVSHRRAWIQVLRVLVAVVIVGSWELTTRLDVVDPFFFGQPSGVVQRLPIWIPRGTAHGPLWVQL